jgi:hypothetical protein
MEKEDINQEIEFLESELDLSHAILDIAGPKPLKDLIAKARLGYENASQSIGMVRDPIQLSRITAKLNRLRARLSRSSCPAPSAVQGLSMKATP